MSEQTLSQPPIFNAVPPDVPETRAREFWLSVRKALLEQTDAIERLLNIRPRTAELRAQMRAAKRDSDSGKTSL